MRTQRSGRILLGLSLKLARWHVVCKKKWIRFRVSHRPVRLIFHLEFSMLRSILVPVDGSPFSEQSLELASSIAGIAKAALDVVLVHVLYWFSLKWKVAWCGLVGKK
jgi:hypothetical protein